MEAQHLKPSCITITNEIWFTIVWKQIDYLNYDTFVRRDHTL